MIIRRHLLRFFVVLSALATVAASPLSSAKAAYPTKPIDWIVMWRAGGGADSATRTFTVRLEKILHQKIIVKNITGGGGSIGYLAAKAAKPDGYTLVTIQGDLPKFKPMGLAPISIDDFDIIAGFAFQSPMIVVKADSPWKTLADFIAAAKAKPGEITVGTTDIGGVFHQPLVLFDNAAKIKTRAIALEGSSRQTVALLGGQVDAVVTWVKATAPYVKDGKLRYLGYMASHRHPDFPNVPTVKELGYDVVWEHPYGVGAPKGIPQDVKKALEAAAAKIWKDPTFVQQLSKQGLSVLRMDSKAYTAHLKRMQADMEKAISLIKK